MTLTELFQIQKKLDERIIKEHGLEGRDLLDKKILSLQVEIGELCQNWRGFKFWSKDQEPRTKAERPVFDESIGEHVFVKVNPLLEEYVDCLHFILSIGTELKSEHVRWFKNGKSIDFSYSSITDQFNRLFEIVGEVNVSTDYECEEYEELFYTFIALGVLLRLDWEQIEQAYMDKNKINIERQNNGY